MAHGLGPLGSSFFPNSLYNQDFGSPSSGMGWHMGSASPDPLVSKVEMLSAELRNVKASLSPLDSKLNQLLELLRNPVTPNTPPGSTKPASHSFNSHTLHLAPRSSQSFNKCIRQSKYGT
ncbi:hypothetical protein K438DRAFT_1775303 [Mycena galopus ATCC 62051]|nr:hypothetical protein K438DRAFT_1775303 [Mycena galopus ATCC 62051]